MESVRTSESSGQRRRSVEDADTSVSSGLSSYRLNEEQNSLTAAGAHAACITYSNRASVGIVSIRRSVVE